MKVNIVDTLPNWARWTFLFLFIVVVALAYHVYNSNIDSKVKSNKVTKKSIELKIDSTSRIRTNKIDQLEKNSISNSKKATQIINNLPHEKTFPTDTTDAYMLHYISKYQFTEY
jgi:hypothetical protein